MKKSIHSIAGIALMSAIVVILQLLGQFIRIGPVSISLVLIPIVVGAAIYGPKAGAVLGGVFGVVVLLQPDTMIFYSVGFWGTIVTVMVKGIVSGWAAGTIYRLLCRKNEFLAVAVAAVISPIMNTGLFSLGCRLFFWDLLAQWGNGQALVYMVTVLIGFNFLAEIIANVLCAPVILRITRIAKKI